MKRLIRTLLDDKLKLIVFLFLLAFYASLIVNKIVPPGASDMPRHIMNGERIAHGDFSVIFKNVYSYTDPDHGFVNHNWLAGVVYYWLYNFVGWTGLDILKLIVLLVSFVILFAATLKKANYWIIAVVSVPAIFILGTRTELRPEMFSFLFIAVTIYALFALEENPDGNKIFWLVPMQLLWVNMHLFFIVGLALVGGFLVQKMFARGERFGRHPLVKKLSLLLGLMAAASLLNPNGIHGALFPFNIFHEYGIRVAENIKVSEYLENKPAWYNVGYEIFAASAWVLALSFLANLRRESIFLALASAATIAAGFNILRTMLFFGIVFLVALSANLQRIAGNPRFKKETAYRILGCILMCGLLAWFSYGQWREGDWDNAVSGIGELSGAQDSVKFFNENGLKGPIFNDYDIGSYLIQNLYPREKVYIDSRPEAYSVDFLNQYYNGIFENEAKWKAALDKYRFNVIFLYRYDQADGITGFMERRYADPEWALVYADFFNAIFARRTPENQALIDRYAVTPENIQEKFQYMLGASRFYQVASAGDIFYLANRFDLAKDAYAKALEKWPNKSELAMITGSLELNSGKFEDIPKAVTHLETAVAQGYKTSESYSYLGQAYFKAGEYQEAIDAITQSLKLDPTRQDALELKNFIIENSKAIK
jgi:tetratricopeptide (TPR) repeat protein